MPSDAAPSEWLRGVLELCVLRAMAEGPTYGYAIAAELAAAGFGELSRAALSTRCGPPRCSVHAGWARGRLGDLPLSAVWPRW